MSEIMSEWDEPQQEMTEITIQTLDNLVKEIAALRADYEAKKKASSEAHDAYEETTQKMIGLLKACGRTTHTLPGVGLVRFATKESYRVPATAEQKRELFKYIQGKYGVDALTEMLSIHAAKINAWANTEIESSPGLTIPGLDAPTSTETFYFNKK